SHVARTRRCSSPALRQAARDWLTVAMRSIRTTIVAGEQGGKRVFEDRGRLRAVRRVALALRLPDASRLPLAEAGDQTSRRAAWRLSLPDTRQNPWRGRDEGGG